MVVIRIFPSQQAKVAVLVREVKYLHWLLILRNCQCHCCLKAWHEFCNLIVEVFLPLLPFKLFAHFTLSDVSAGGGSSKGGRFPLQIRLANQGHLYGLSSVSWGTASNWRRSPLDRTYNYAELHRNVILNCTHLIQGLFCSKAFFKYINFAGQE